MNVRRYEPWSLLTQLNNEMNRLFEQRTRDDDEARLIASDWVPAVDIKEEADRYIIHADVPGVDPKDVDITMDKGVLAIRGQRQAESKEERVGYKRIERVRGSFYRSFSLPETVNADKISAKCSNGVLEIVIPKRETPPSVKVKVSG